MFDLFYSTLKMILSFYIIHFLILYKWICHGCFWSHSGLRPSPKGVNKKKINKPNIAIIHYYFLPKLGLCWSCWLDNFKLCRLKNLKLFSQRFLIHFVGVSVFNVNKHWLTKCYSSKKQFVTIANFPLCKEEPTILLKTCFCVFIWVLIFKFYFLNFSLNQIN